MNNGITIVADSINITGDKATITNYQIVNGCQTSHVIFDNEDVEGIDDLMLPIRLIATINEDLKNDITRATNNQTSIKKEQLEALSTFQRTLEEYYKTYSDSEIVLYYERSTGQYRNKGVCPAQIISIPMQIKAVSSMFLDNPHGVSGQYGTIAKNAGKKLFKENNKPILYYVSALEPCEVCINAAFIKKYKVFSLYSKCILVPFFAFFLHIGNAPVQLHEETSFYMNIPFSPTLFLQFQCRFSIQEYSQFP